jgi:UDP-N-acetylmuramoyl-L-alanine---L-glutamate ligase
MKHSGARTGLERLRGRTVAIWGPGIEGICVARAALERGATVSFVDDRAHGREAIDVDGVGVPVLAPSVLGSQRFDCLVRSPGISIYREELASATGSGCGVTSATEMWLEDFSGSRIVGVTGTKGKTTTAWLTALLLEACGMRVGLGGNMGTPVTALYDEEPSDAYVVEISSFQGADVTISPTVGVLTLLAPDHLDWHGTYDNYVRDKLNLFTHGPHPSLAVNSTSPDAAHRTAEFATRQLYGSTGRVKLEGGRLVVDGAVLADADSLALRGEHNLVNLCGALTACLLVADEVPNGSAVAETVVKMPALPSRLQTVAVCSGVEFVNDALASNPAGAVAALRTFAGRNVCLITGGNDRGVDLAPLVEAITTARPQLSLVTLPGMGARLSRELAASGVQLPCESATTMQEAVGRAAELVGGEGVVLFSPAAPTPEVEGTYLQRGAAFDDAVAKLRRRVDPTATGAVSHPDRAHRRRRATDAGDPKP